MNKASQNDAFVLAGNLGGGGGGGGNDGSGNPPLFPPNRMNRMKEQKQDRKPALFLDLSPPRSSKS